MPAAAELRGAYASALQENLTPNAGPPPRLTAPAWASVCRGHRRCGTCVVCDWEREAERWSFVAPWRRVLSVGRPDGGARWRGLRAALVALADWERHGRAGPSAIGFVLARLQRGEQSDGGASRPGDPLLEQAGEVAPVYGALAAAYPDGGHKTLSAAVCKGVLMARTPGVIEGRVPSYADLAAVTGATDGELKALVRAGRRIATVYLAARGVIDDPPIRQGLAEAIFEERRRIVNAQ